MNLENKKLGRGLGSLLSSVAKTEDKNFKFINISEIQANQNQPRKNFKKEDLEDLANSIKSQGVLQPIVVRITTNNNYEIIAGERRWRSAQIAGIHEIPAVIKEMSDDKAQEAALIENIQRENLNAVEEARTYKTILENNDSDYEGLGKVIGKSKSHRESL